MLSLTVFLPLACALVLAVPGLGPRAAAWWWVGASAAEVALVGGLWWAYETPAAGELAFEEQVPWIPGVGSSYHVGLDGLSLPLVAMTAVVFLAAAVYSLREPDRPRTRAALFLALETVCLGLFAASDLLLFFVFFDLSIVAMYFVIAGWGHGDRARSALRFFLYTFLGSLALLAGFIGLYLSADPHTFDIVELGRQDPLAGQRHHRGRRPRRRPARAGGQDPDRPLPHLAAARPHRRARRGVGRPRRRPAQAGHVRLRPGRDAPAAGGLAVVGLGRRRRRRRLGLLGRARRPGAAATSSG